MNSQKLWQRLSAQGLIQGSEPAHPDSESELWYVRVIQGLAGWLAAWLVLAFLGFGLFGLFEHGWLVLILGLVMNWLAWQYYKRQVSNEFMLQVVLVLSLCGQFLVVFGLFQILGIDWWMRTSRWWLILVAMYQTVLVLLMANFLHRFLSAWFALMAAYWAIDLWHFTGLGSTLIGAALVWLWLDRVGWQAARELYEPVAYALAVALIQFALHGLIGWQPRTEPLEVGWLMGHGGLLALALNAAVLFYLVFRLFQENRVDPSQREGQVLWLGAILVVLASLMVPGLAASLLVLLLGMARQNRVLQVLGGLALLGFVAWYYYWMDQSLLLKAMYLSGLGLVFLLVAKLWQSGFEHTAQTATGGSVLRRPQTWVPLVAVVLTLVLMNVQIMHKERVLQDGQTVLLELAPVDPRSIMQGDYMRLRFAISEEIRRRHEQANSAEINQSGTLVVGLDSHRVGHLRQLQALNPLTSDEVLMQYRIRDGRVKLATNAFFFQEGKAELYEQARYGVFKVDADGSLLLYAMADKNHQILGVNRLVE